MNGPEAIAFILSTGRTGTKTLAEGLAGDDIKSPHQPPFSRLLTVAGNYHLHGWLSLTALEWLVARLREPQIARAGCRYYVQVFSLDYWPAKILRQKYANVSIIHLVRDPRTFVPSYLNWTRTRRRSFIANRLVLGWHPSGYFCGRFSWREWRRLDEFQRVCWHWTFKNGLVEQLFAGDARYRRIRFENLFGERNVALLKETLAFAGIPFRPHHAALLKQEKNLSRKTYCPPWDALPAARQAQLYRLCGARMQVYGYT